MRRTHPEHISSALPPIADVREPRSRPSRIRRTLWFNAPHGWNHWTRRKVYRPNASYLRELDQMPWTANEAERHIHKATTPTLKELWAKVANESLERTGDEGLAIREANVVIARQAGTSK